MMTLLEASDLVTLILKSGLVGKTPVLDEKFKVVEACLKGYNHSGPFSLNQFKILDEKSEKSVKDLVNCFEQIQLQEKEAAFKKEIMPWCPNCGDVYITNTPESYTMCESCGNLLSREEEKA